MAATANTAANKLAPKFLFPSVLIALALFLLLLLEDEPNCENPVPVLSAAAEAVVAAPDVAVAESVCAFGTPGPAPLRPGTTATSLDCDDGGTADILVPVP